MSALVTFRISDRAMRKVAAAAAEHHIGIKTHLALIVEAAVALYEAEDRDGVPRGRATAELRPQRWKPRKWTPSPIFHEMPARNVTASRLGDPPPGRSALDQKRAAR